MGGESKYRRSRIEDNSRQDFQSHSGNPLDDQVRPEDPAYILFTSGSTGVPKGVVITHANVIHFVEWAVRYFGINSADKISGHPPHHFDLSVFDLFGSLAAGASLHLVAPELNFYPNKLAEFILHSGLTQWFSVPSILNYMAKLDVVKQNDFPTLKRILVRRGFSDPVPDLLDETVAPCDIHRSLWADRSNHCEQLLYPSSVSTK